MAKTSIQIDTKTRDKLHAVGKHGETYDQIINKLLQS